MYPPALYNNYYSFNSALTIQNVGAVAAAGTVTYSNGQQVNFNLAPGAAQELYQPANPNLPSGNAGGVFAAKVQATTGSVVGLVSLSSSAGGAFASYNVPSTPSTAVKIPNINSDYYGFFTAVTVQNTGSSATDIKLVYPDGSFVLRQSVAPNATTNFIHLNGAGDQLPNRTSTVGTVESYVPGTSNTGEGLVAVIQHNTDPGVAGYNPGKVPSDFLFAVTGAP